MRLHLACARLPSTNDQPGTSASFSGRAVLGTASGVPNRDKQFAESSEHLADFGEDLGSGRHHGLLTSRILTLIICTMNARQRKSPVTDLLRSTIAKSGIPYNQLERATGVKRASIIRFLRGDQSMRLDLAERLMVYFGLEVRKRK
jgi:hypothetical protein